MTHADLFFKTHFDGIPVKSGELGYTADQVRLIVDAVIEKKWIILGGDVYDENGLYTYNNWYYTPVSSDALVNNSVASAVRCIEFVKKVEDKKSGQLYVLVISDAYISGI